MRNPTKETSRRSIAGAIALSLLGGSSAFAQTTAGIGTTIVFPVTAQTVSFASEITLFNPGPSLLLASVKFYEANNSAAPGPKTCNDVSVSAGRSVQLQLPTQCALVAGSHFGLLVIADKAVPASHAFYGFSRVQNPQGIGFSVEGFPLQDFNNQVAHATGLKRQTGTPTFQTNCFVGSLDQPVSYELRLFNDASGAQIGGALVGSLAAFQQFRYLDVFGSNGVNAPAGNLTNVRAQFTQTSGGTANLIGFCTVQDNTSFGADFRIAKSFGSPSDNFFAQGGNTFGTVAKLGTLDDQPLSLVANNQPVVTYLPNPDSPNIVSGHPNNAVNLADPGQVVAGGGAAGSDCIDPPSGHTNRPCSNRVTASYSAIGGGFANLASGFGATVGGGSGNTASGNNSTVPGGFANVASGSGTFAAGSHATANLIGCGVLSFWSTSTQMPCEANNHLRIGANHGISVDYFAQTDFGIGTRWVSIGDLASDRTITTWTGAYLHNAGVWNNASDRDKKENFAPVDAREILARVAALPVTHWNYRIEPGVRRIGPVAQDFHAAFGLGNDDKTIATGDEMGVALAAIQGLHQLVQEKDARIDALELAVKELTAAVAALTASH